MIDTNEIIRAYLAADAGLIPLVGSRIYCPRLPENADLPAIGFFTRGGTANPHIPEIPGPSVQFDCWGTSFIEARQVYRALYDALQGLQDEKVTIGADTYMILSAIEEVQGQDLADPEIQGYYRTLCFFSFIIR